MHHVLSTNRMGVINVLIRLLNSTTAYGIPSRTLRLHSIASLTIVAAIDLNGTAKVICLFSCAGNAEKECRRICQSCSAFSRYAHRFGVFSYGEAEEMSVAG